MAVMNSFARFFVNLGAPRRNARRFRWLEQERLVDAGSVILEIGCGNADLAARVVDGIRPAKYVATDLDPAQVELARTRLHRSYGRAPPAALEVAPADMLSLPFPSESFDTVLAYTSLHHASPNHHDASEVPRALTEVDRVLRPGGRLVYEEFLHRDLIRGWLTQHGYQLGPVRRAFRSESVAARKPYLRRRRAAPAGPATGAAPRNG